MMVELPERHNERSIEMIEKEGLWFYEKVIFIDGYVFKNCRFDKCTLAAKTPHFRIENCLIDDNSFVYPIEDVTQIVKLSRLPNLAYNPELFDPKISKEGFITIVPDKTNN